MRISQDTEPRVLSYRVRNDNASNYGKQYWIVGLGDGREMTLWADEIQINDGCLEAWQTEKTIDPQLAFSLAPGIWLYAFEANPLDGLPCCVQSLPESN